MADDTAQKPASPISNAAPIPEWLKKAQALESHEERGATLAQDGQVVAGSQATTLPSLPASSVVIETPETPIDSTLPVQVGEIKKFDKLETDSSNTLDITSKQDASVEDILKGDAPIPEWLKKASVKTSPSFNIPQVSAVFEDKIFTPVNDQIILPNQTAPLNELNLVEPIVTPVQTDVAGPLSLSLNTEAVPAPISLENQPTTVVENENKVENFVQPVIQSENFTPPVQAIPETVPMSEPIEIQRVEVENIPTAAVFSELEKPQVLEPSVVQPVSVISSEQNSLPVQPKASPSFFDGLKNVITPAAEKIVIAAEQGKVLLEKSKTAGIPASFKTGVPLAPTLAQSVSLTDTKKTTAEDRKKLVDAEKIYQQGIATIRDLIAPSSMEIRYNMLRVEGFYAQTFFVYTYPRYLDINWLSPIVNFDVTMDIAQFIYPIDSAAIMTILKKKVGQMQSSVRMASDKGIVRDPALETALEDAEELRTQIQRGQEKFFQFALYFTIYSDDEKKMAKIAKQLESILGGKLILTKKSELQMEQGFNSTLPMCLDELEVTRNMNTSPLSTTFPFSSADLTSDEGILYGLNRHNDSLIIFDRFSLENANSVVFAKSGAGKSYCVKLEILRSLMLGTDVIVIDPENEYEALSQTVGGSYLRVSLTSDRRINPFDLPSAFRDEELQPGDLLRSNIINLHGLLKIMLGGVTPSEEGILDKALNDVYAVKGITMDMLDPSQLVPPTMEDLYDILSTMEGGQSLAQRLQKYTQGTYSGIFNKPTNIDMNSGLMVFSIRDLEDGLRPIAMYIILNFIWNRVRSELKKRILVIDEAWTLMQYEDSGRFLFGLVKRARKYYLGITTITQDVEDFVKSPYGKPVITNSSMQLLLKQAPSAIETLSKVFNLTEGERYMLLNSGVGQGLFFAGLKHVAIQVIASYSEDKIITTNPEEVLRSNSEGEEYKS